MLLAAAAVSIRSADSHRLHRPPIGPEEREKVGIAMCAPWYFDRVDRPRRPAEAFRLGLDARLTPLLQIDGYPTSTVPSRADRSPLSDST